MKLTMKTNRIMIRKIMLLTLLLGSLGVKVGFGQIDDDDVFSLQWPSMDQLIRTPNSPEATAFTKYGNTPVSLYTGRPDISIPLHNLKGRDFEMPISLSYDASGIQVNQIATWVGLGWNLNAGGVITRKVNGQPDDYLPGSSPAYDIFYDDETYGASQKTVKEMTNILNTQGFTPDEGGSIYEAGLVNDVFQFVGEVSTSHIETQPDIYNINIAGISGELYIDYDQYLGNRKYKAYCRERPDLDIKVVIKSESCCGLIIEAWEVKDPMGTVFIFGKDGSEQTQQIADDPGDEPPLDRIFNSAWYITGIITANSKDSIQFNYSDILAWEREQAYGSVEMRRESQMQPDCGTADLTYPLSSNVPKIKVHQRTLESITVNGFQQVQFSSSDSSRRDLRGRKALKSIIVRNNLLKEVKRINLVHSYFGDENNHTTEFELRLRLDEVVIHAGSPDPERYIFEYLGDDDDLPSRKSFGRDHWGFYNGKDQNSTLIPYNPTFDMNNFGGFRGGDRNANFIHARKGTLNKIIYPTGGYTQFTYKPNADISEEPVTEKLSNFYFTGSKNEEDPLNFDCTDCCDHWDGGGGDASPAYHARTFLVPGGQQPNDSSYRDIDSAVYDLVIDIVGVEDCSNGDQHGPITVALLDNCPQTFSGQPDTIPLPDPVLCLDSAASPYCLLSDTGRAIFTEQYSSRVMVKKPVKLRKGAFYGLFVVSSDPCKQVYVSVQKDTTQSILEEQGGLRIHKIEDYNTLDSLVTSKYYYYDDPCTNDDETTCNLVDTLTIDYLENNQASSGRQHMSDQRYETPYRLHGGETSVCSYINRYSNSLAPQVTPHYTYDAVTEILYSASGLNGFTVHKFKNESRTYPNGYPVPRLAPLNGKMLEKRVYDKDLNLRQKTVKTYKADSVNGVVDKSGFFLHTDGWYPQYAVAKAQSSESGSPHYFEYKNATYQTWGATIDISIGGLQKCLDSADHDIWCAMDDVTTANYQLKKYTLNPYWIKNDTTIIFDFTSNGQLKNTMVFDYSNPYHFQVTQKTMIDSEGDTITMCYQYPHDALNNEDQINEPTVLNNLINDHRIALGVKQLKKINGNVTQQQASGFFSPTADKIFQNTIQASTSNNPMEPLIRIHQYDDYGNPVEISKERGMKTIYLWGYNYSLTIAKIENASYDQVIDTLKSITNNSDPLDLLQKNIPYIQDSLITTKYDSIFNQLRNALPHSLITVYDHDPLVGLKATYDPSGLKTTFEYDNNNRLKFVRDHEGNILEHYQYNFKNPNQQ